MKDDKEDRDQAKEDDLSQGLAHPDQCNEKEPRNEGKFSSDGFTVVGIGASAGGLEAFVDLLSALPTDTGMVFVLVQHLDPHHESILAELLAHRTAMPVQQVHADTPIEPDHIYVIPPNSTMIISGRVLKLSPRTVKERHMPIDTFLTSLAEEMGANSVGVILSGTASDGTLGLKAIKTAGGVTFCQDSSAKFDSMPRSAIAVGAADFVLRPQKIAEELAAIAQHPYYLRREQFAVAQNGSALQKILHLLRVATGVDFTEYKQPTIQRRLMRRMALQKIESLDAYRSLAEGNPAELELLFEDLLINVTEFFRDPSVFQTLKRLVIPALLKNRKPGQTVRVWVPGCSSGEEIYSIGISLLEYFDENQLDFPIRMFGTDVSDKIIDRARAGIYPASIVSSLSPERIRRFFVKADSGYQINRTVRDICVFSRHNVARDPPLSRMDLISCRNLLIYLKTALQKRVISMFGYALDPSGCLILGTSETPGPLSEHFSAIDLKHKIFCLKPNLHKSVFELPVDFTNKDERLLPPSAPTPFRALEEGDGSEEVRRYVDQMFLVRFGPSALVVNQDFKIVEVRGDGNRFLIRTNEITGRDLFETVRSELTLPLRRAIQDAMTHQTTIKIESLQIREQDTMSSILAVVVPIRLPAASQFFLVVFEDGSEGAPGGPPATRDPKTRTPPMEPQRHIDHLEQELNSTRHYLQAIIEELRSSNEEAQSTNEELQSTNEELQTAKEEMQSSNEELNTINSEMQSRNLELAQVNDDLTNLLSSMNMPVIMVGHDLRLRRFTPMAETVLHLIPSDIGRLISDLQPRINVGNLEKLLRQVLDSLVPYEEEVEDQQGRSYLLRVRPYRASTNRIEGAVLQLLDIGELKRSLEEARHARDYAQAIVDTVREPLIVLDDKFVARDANRSFYNYFRVSRSEVIGKRLVEILPPDLSEKLHNLLSALIEAGTPIQNQEFDDDTGGKGTRTFVVNARRMPTGDGIQVLVAFQDVTERKQATEARYRRLFESAKDGIMIVDSVTGAVADVNPYFEQLFGYPRTELLGSDFREAGPLKALSEGGEALTRIREEGALRFSDETLESKDGRSLQIEILGNIYSEGNRRLVQFNIRDLTERRKFERELQHTAKLESLGLLAGGIAHDFNNLLTGVLGNASLLYAETQPGDANRSSLRDIIRAGERAAQLTQQMLAFAGKGRVLSERIVVPDFIRDILTLVKASISKTVEVTLDFADDTPEIEGDPSQLQQLIMNLVINGAEAIGESRQGRLEISTRRTEITADNAAEWSRDLLVPGYYLLIEVCDNGMGMDEATIARIFDPFFTTKFTGRGLGLAAALGIVKGHRGALRVSSTPGRGSSFRVFLPVSHTHAAVIAPKRAQQPRRGSATILVVDDEVTVRNIVRRGLGSLGYNVLSAENGKEGVELFGAHKDEVRLVLLDLRMPVMGGEEALGRIRDIHPDIPVVLLSGYDEAEAVRRFGTRPRTAFLQKPYTFQRLAEVVSNLLPDGVAG